MRIWNWHRYLQDNSHRTNVQRITTKPKYSCTKLPAGTNMKVNNRCTVNYSSCLFNVYIRWILITSLAAKYFLLSLINKLPHVRRKQNEYVTLLFEIRTFNFAKCFIFVWKTGIKFKTAFCSICSKLVQLKFCNKL